MLLGLLNSLRFCVSTGLDAAQVCHWSEMHVYGSMLPTAMTAPMYGKHQDSFEIMCFTIAAPVVGLQGRNSNRTSQCVEGEGVSLHPGTNP